MATVAALSEKSAMLHQQSIGPNACRESSITLARSTSAARWGSRLIRASPSRLPTKATCIEKINSKVAEIPRTTTSGVLAQEAIAAEW